MNEISILLKDNQWYYSPDHSLGPPGGFGEVFLGRSAKEERVAVKRVKLLAESSARRELKMAEYLVSGTFDNIMPVLDSGRDQISGFYFIVMPVAEMSLQEAVNAGVHDIFTAVSILLQIANGLAEMPDIVHRDLKPGNVLKHEERWKITDFGIARFADVATASDTMKDAMSAHFAAPEQWRFERATSATDVYALGCIGYALITGAPPFIGSSRDELRAQHLGADAPEFPDTVPAPLKTLLSTMLRKAPESRPSVLKITTVLNQIALQRPQNFGIDALAKAAAKVERDNAVQERLATVKNLAWNDRESLARTGRAILSGLSQELKSLALVAAPNASCSRDGKITLGTGILHLPSQTSTVLPNGLFKECGWDVVLGEAIGAIRVGTRESRNGYVFSSSLWYAILPNTAQCRWYEVSYWAPYKQEKLQPCDLTDNPADADKAAAAVLHTFDICWGPRPIDDEDSDEFKERWLALFAKAVAGSLTRPSTLPLRPYFWKDGQL